MTMDHRAPGIEPGGFDANQIRDLFAELDRRLRADGETAALYAVGQTRQVLANDNGGEAPLIEVEFRAGRRMCAEIASEMADGSNGRLRPGWLTDERTRDDRPPELTEDHRKTQAWAGQALVVHAASPERMFAREIAAPDGPEPTTLRELANELDIRSVADAEAACRAVSLGPTQVELPAAARDALAGFLPAETPGRAAWSPRTVDARTALAERASIDAAERIPETWEGPEAEPERNWRTVDTDPESPTYGYAVGADDPEDDEIPYHVYAHLETTEERQQAVDDYVRELEWDPAVHQAVLDAEAAWEAEHGGEDPPLDETPDRDRAPEQPALPIPEMVERPSAEARYARTGRDTPSQARAR